eukprot:CAMPEP_0202695842 /NCGR_PEP_ID=MMETSP1385-20130828/9314_1 /ASSEMBLY_ACC=CAM_ASM_000861 /TAXON_ID=933848 /ORGANISM="Elphidium margaritaceum" /LENGTH=191 /DNA_ID=CAMNT_0049351921 /DNA_START=33 /DNA_END=608 /DNA_ORIENTATION=+
MNTLYRLSRPITACLRRRALFTAKPTASMFRVSMYCFGHKSAKDINHPHLGFPSPGCDPHENSLDNPYLWDPNYLPCDESDWDRSEGIMMEYEKGRWAIKPEDQVRNLTAQEALTRVIKVVKKMERAHSDNKLLGKNTHLYNDLALDSLDVVEFGLALEEEFSIEIPDEEAEQILTLGDAVELLIDTPNAV